MSLGDIIAPSCSKDKLWNALADAVNDASMDTMEKITCSGAITDCYLSLKRKVDTQAT